MLHPRGAFPQRCDECQYDDSLRLEFGCDGPTACAESTAEIECPACRGKNARCDHCEGDGVIAFRRCPWQVLEPVHTDFIRAALLVADGVLPAEGGWHDQANTFVKAYSFARNQIAHWHEKAIEDASK